MALVTREDIIAGYDFFLGRSPESEEVIAFHLAPGHELWAWILSLANSEEAQRHRADVVSDRFSLQNGVNNIDVEITPEYQKELIDHIRSVWSKYGDEDPYWSVMTADEYRSDVIGSEGIDRFYQTGAWDLAGTLEAACQRNGILLDRASTVLDLGCGVGRIGEHLARNYGGYIGVDISSGHLKLAKERFSSQNIQNAQWMLLQDFLNSPKVYDVFYSMIALQHNPPPIMYWLLIEFLTRLKLGGYAFFQIPCYLYDYKFQISDYLKMIEIQAGMESHALPQAYVFKALHECGLVPLEIMPCPRIGPVGFSYSFLAHKVRNSASQNKDSEKLEQ